MTIKWSFVIICSLAAVKAQNGYPRDNPSSKLTYDQGYEFQGHRAYDDEMSGGEIPGEAGKDYPILSEVPETRFDCKQQQFPGYYADPEAMCQVFHICQNGGRKDSFLCPNGTVFNQEKLVCDWWYNFECSQAQSYYAVNEAIVMAMEEADRLSAAKMSSEGYRYNSPQGQNKHQGSADLGTRPQDGFNAVVVEGSRGSLNGGYSAPRGSAPSGQYSAPRGSAPRGQYPASRRPGQGHAAANRAQSHPLQGAPQGPAHGPLQQASDSFRYPAAQAPALNLQEQNAYNSPNNYEITGASFGNLQHEDDAEEPNREYLPARF